MVDVHCARCRRVMLQLMMMFLLLLSLPCFGGPRVIVHMLLDELLDSRKSERLCFGVW